jgi:AcrR family transcriptional regulator
VARRTDTRGRLLRTAAGLLRQQGYNATGLNQVLAQGQAPKGVLYFHFPGGKEQLAAEAITLSGGELREAIATVVTAAPDAITGILALGELFARTLEESGFREGCPVATVALEAADNEPIRAACDGVYSSWLKGLRMRLRAWGVAEEEAGPLAAVVLSSLQGALMLARVQRDVAVIRTVTQRVSGLVDQAVRS